jgi:predicted nucleotidyltransferase
MVIFSSIVIQGDTKMNKSISERLKFLKSSYQREGFLIIGVFGSCARGEETPDSDIDILYETTDEFKREYNGLKYFGRIEDIKEELKKDLNRAIDIADKSCLNRIGRKYILPGVVYV